MAETESSLIYPDSPLDQDEAIYPCKGCGEILEEGKAFELAGNRWHIDCFRCNTCSTLLNSDANLLLLGDGSLICNNCTYSCSSCNNKIEDLAILTGDQAFCANCFKCRNCKKKIENLRYARTSQGIFCMDCHEALMARRRKKTARNAAQRQKASSNNSLLDKSLPSLPPSAAPKNAFSVDIDTPPSEVVSETPTEMPLQRRLVDDNHHGVVAGNKELLIAESLTNGRDALTLSSSTFKNYNNNNRHSFLSQKSDAGGPEEFLIPVAFDPTPPATAPSPPSSNHKIPKLAEEKLHDYFGQKAPIDARRSRSSSPHVRPEKELEPSPDIMEQMRRRREGSNSASASAAASPRILPQRSRPQPSESPRMSQGSQEGGGKGESFKLQDAPKAKRSLGSNRSNKASAMSPRSLRALAREGQELAQEKNRESAVVGASIVQEPDFFVAQRSSSPRPPLDVRVRENGSMDSSQSMLPTLNSLQYPPKRGDSLEGQKANQTIPRKEIFGLAPNPQAFKDTNNDSQSSTPSNPPINAFNKAVKVNGGKAISKPIESPSPRSIFDPPTSITDRADGAEATPTESFVDPRPPPLPPTNPARMRSDSISTFQSDATKTAEHPISPVLPRYSAGGEFTMEEDMARILGGEEGVNHESFLRRVSNSVRHGRSFSDRGTRLSKERWPRSPNVAHTPAAQEISSPSTASPEHRDELSWFKNELRRERQKAIEREQKISELEATLDSTANIKQVNTELREKRSTMVVLDTQKEMVVRELEVLTEHIAAARKNGDPLDLGKMNNAIMRDFAESLQKLKDSFAPQIEESIQKRNDLVDEISNLTQMKDKSLQEFEQLSLKNAQLAELNNQLVHQIQGLYKANSGNTVVDGPRSPAPNGLGIYSHHKDKSQISIDSREPRFNLNESSIASSSTTLQQEEAEPATMLQGPHMVNIRKGQQAKRFNWKKGGQNVAKGVTKGLKGAFASTQQSYSRDLQFAETLPYAATQPGEEPRAGGLDPNRQGLGFFANQKPPPKGSAQWKTHPNGSSPGLSVDASLCLYGSYLEQRSEFEKASIPYIVTRCIDEVEHRGMDIEGIYRKSGGTSQIQTVKEYFERPSPGFDLSDPDLDIHAVTSSLKQYFRRLPNPLITYEVYDKIIETNDAPAGSQSRVEAMTQALMELPKVHREVLELLVYHLKRVVEQEEENLMTSMNIAVVFAPTIMRPESLVREMADTQKKNEVVQFLVENCQSIFAAMR